MYCFCFPNFLMVFALFFYFFAYISILKNIKKNLNIYQFEKQKKYYWQGLFSKKKWFKKAKNLTI